MFDNKAIVGCFFVACFIAALMWNSAKDSEQESIEHEVARPAESFVKSEPVNEASINEIAALPNNTISSTRSEISERNEMRTFESGRLAQSQSGSQSVSRTDGVDEIGGYFDGSAIAPEDEVPQNNFIDSIGYEDPTSEDPATSSVGLPTDESIETPVDDDTIM